MRRRHKVTDKEQEKDIEVDHASDVEDPTPALEDSDAKIGIYGLFNTKLDFPNTHLKTGFPVSFCIFAGHPLFLCYCLFYLIFK